MESGVRYCGDSHISYFMWALIFERVYYFLYGHDEVTSDIKNKFSKMKFKSRWHENQIKARFVSEGRTAINRNVQLIQLHSSLSSIWFDGHSYRHD